MTGGGGSPVIVRVAAPHEHADAGSVTALAYREFVGEGEDGWRAYLGSIADVDARADRTTILDAEVEGRIVGSATLELSDRVEPGDDPPLDPSESHMRMLGVHPDARRQGVARALVHACIDRSRRHGKTFMTLHTTERMGDAQRLYEALGFERLDDRVFPDGFVLLTFRLDL
jgi:ribosomal protein S18 acetylase RimI-like enzyme